MMLLASCMEPLLSPPPSLIETQILHHIKEANWVMKSLCMGDSKSPACHANITQTSWACKLPRNGCSYAPPGPIMGHSEAYLVMSKRSFPLLDLLLLESRVTESVVERSVGVRVVVSTSEISAIFLFVFQIARASNYGT